MKFNDLKEFITHLQDKGELIYIEEELSTRHEIAAAMKLVDQRRGGAVLFERVKGYDVSVVGNVLGTRRRLETALGAKGDLVNHYLDRTHNPIQPVVVEAGPAKEVVLKDHIDILKVMPVLTHHEKDVGPYMTSAVIIAKDPDTGIRGMGIHRIQIKGKNKLGILLASPPISRFFTHSEEKGVPLEIAIVVGMDPITWFSSVIWAPKGIDKFDLAGGLKGEAIELVQCESVNLEVPAHAEFVLEGRVLPHVREQEGPFGESTGVYLTYDNPIAEIEVITHRRKPLYHGLMPFTSEESVLMGVSWEAENLKSIQNVFPQVERAHINPLDFGQLIVQINKKSEEDPKGIIDYVLELNPHTKSAIIIDTDVDLYSPKEVAWALFNRFQVEKDIVIKKDLPGSIIDPSVSEKYRTSKIGFDATRPFGQKEKFEKIGLSGEVESKIRDLFRDYPGKAGL